MKKQPNPQKRPQLKISGRISHRRKKGGLARAAIALAGNLANPRKVGTSIKKAIQKKGLVLPGSNFIGPWNEMHGPVLNRGDAIAKKHDLAYEKLQKKGARDRDIYLGYSHADREALKKGWKAAKKGSGSALAVAGGMGVKALAHKAGLTKKFSKGVRKFEK